MSFQSCEFWEDKVLRSETAYSRADLDGSVAEAWESRSTWTLRGAVAGPAEFEELWVVWEDRLVLGEDVEVSERNACVLSRVGVPYTLAGFMARVYFQ